jgi:hypothetical protein
MRRLEVTNWCLAGEPDRLPGSQVYLPVSDGCFHVRDARFCVADRCVCGRALRCIGIGTRIVETDSNVRESALRMSGRGARISGEVARMVDSCQCISGGDLPMRGSCARMHRKQPPICVGDARLLGIDQNLCATALLLGGATLEWRGRAERMLFDSQRLCGASFELLVSVVRSFAGDFGLLGGSRRI